jgi:hypothetical protein
MKTHFVLIIILVFFSCQMDKKDKSEEEAIESIEYFDFESLSSEAKAEFSEDYWLGSGKISNVSIANGGAVIGISDDNGLYKKLIVTENNIVVSYSYGQNSKTIIYDKKLAKLTEISFSMFATGISGDDILTVEKDYYDSLDPQDPNYKGHIFENGKYNLKTGQYTFISNL